MVVVIALPKIIIFALAAKTHLKRRLTWTVKNVRITRKMLISD